MIDWKKRVQSRDQMWKMADRFIIQGLKLKAEVLDK